MSHEPVEPAIPQDDKVKYIDMTPTWEAMLPGMLAVLITANQDIPHERQSLLAVRGEMTRMAQAADKWNAAVRLGKVRP